MRVESMMHPLLSYSEPDHDDGDLDDEGQSDSHTSLSHHHGMDTNKAEIRKVRIISSLLTIHTDVYLNR